MDLVYADEFFKIKKACIEVKQILGNGFMEKVYENALVYELIHEGFTVETQKELDVIYKGELVGLYIADIIIDNKIIIEMKTVHELNNLHRAQLLNYLKITGFDLGVLINFPNDRTGFDIERLANTK